MAYDIHIPSTLLIGGGSRHGVGELAKKFGLDKVIIISDEVLKKLGIVDEIVKSFETSGLKVYVYTGVNPDPTVENVAEALDVLKTEGCTGVVAVGGGSSIDTAKAVAVMATNEGWIGDYMGYHKVPKPGIPLIAIPTTAGTGSEATRVTIITDTAKNLKMMCLDNAFMPCAAIVDYELTMGMPKSLTAAVGIDALTHAIEAYVSKKANMVSDMYALSAIELIYKNLLTAYEHPSNEAAREAVMLGANEAGIAFSNSSVCTVHGMSRPIGAHFHIPHGLSNAMLLPLVTQYSIEGACNRYADIARRMGLCGLEKSDEEACSMLVDELKSMNKKMNVPNLQEYGVDFEKYEGLLPDMAKAAIASGSPGNNPTVFAEAKLIELYCLAYDYK